MRQTHRLVITAADHSALMRHLAGVTDERMAFAFCGRSDRSDGTDWLCRTIDLPGDEEYRHQGPGGVALRSDRVVGRILRARKFAAMVDIHSHPFSSRPMPSGTDTLGVAVHRRVLRDLAPGTAFLRIITGVDDVLWADWIDLVTGSSVPIDEVVVLDLQRRRVVRPVNAGRVEDAIVGDDVAHSRTRAVLGSLSTNRLIGARVAVIGVGGVGSAVAWQVAGLVGHLDLIDPDHVEIHNLPRLYGATVADVGRPKVEALRDALGARSPSLEVSTCRARFPNPASLAALRDADIVVACPDHHAVRWSVADAAARHMKPLVEVGCGGRRAPDGSLSALGYHVRLQVPGGPCLACLGIDFSGLEDPESTDAKRAIGYIDGDPDVPGELVTLTTRAASDAAELLVRYLSGYAPKVPRHLFMNALELRVLDLTAGHAPRPGCTLCGADEDNIRGLGVDITSPLASSPVSEVDDVAL